jgi:phage replication initiation protein
MRSEILTDWFTFSVPEEENPLKIIEEYLGMEPKLFTQTYGKLRGYYKSLEYGHIAVGYEAYGIAKGVCVSMSGQGCRTYENYGDFETLRKKCNGAEGVNITRWDIACDEKSGVLNMKEMTGLLMNGQLRSHCKRRHIHIEFDGNDTAGSTLYIGSKKSDCFIRIYDKAKEAYDKKKEPELYNTPWIRVELVLKKQYASNASLASETHDKFFELVAQMINGHMSFINLDDSNISRCSVVSWWTEFLESIEKIKIWSKGEIRRTFDKCLNWVADKYAPILAMLYDGLGAPGFRSILIKRGRDRLSEKHKTMMGEYQNQRKQAAKIRA